MTPPLVAGVDIGNATTEVVLADATTGTPVAWDRTMTRGAKGSPSSVQGAAALVRRLARRVSGTVALAAVAPLRPVRTSAATVPEPPPDTGRFRVLTAGVSSPGGSGVGIGRPVPLDEVPASGEPVVALVAVGYREAAARLRALLSAGAPIVAVLLAADEARLVANRLGAPVPIVDGVDLAAVAGSALVAVEVAEPGRPLRSLTDPLFLATSFGATSFGAVPADSGALRRVARQLADVSSAVVTVGGSASDVSSEPLPSRVWTPDGAVSLAEAARLLADARPGAFARYALDGGDPIVVADLAVVDVGALASSLLFRAGTNEGGYALAGLLPTAGPVPADVLLGSALGVPVVCATSEATAAHVGAVTTPGAPPDAVVVDLGGGTVDVVRPEGERVVAGGGDLLTAAVALGLGVTRGAAEWAKRGPAVRLETPQLATQEDGDKTFLPVPQQAGAVGWLAAPGPAGLLPISVRIGPAEWRSFRLALKQAVLGTAVRRGLQDGVTGTVLVVGGPAGDDEVLRIVDAVLPDGVGLGRGNVAGALGHRYAVAWGLALAALAAL
ncbi:diol dehydratase reactivase ATPase-like domain-containing protein [Cryptosporangium aurantiacum]|uniref:Diol dehydratase reactivase ATPase-like domain-containing protein n=1 Tax=Cryptosporangium aurantiacum TaxID=134849 RepID=A0A1M7QD14_9ACTN|nr:diol dehydratase reactivase ATPase-like domain-containing protein [Cryptosporangium aurantiacum]SHN28722.1 Diol dehydratase reactivase ATPase-like domain-containing protein [Cryptosporangium aurantiacum]